MKHSPNPRRGRPRGNGKRFHQTRPQNFESNGADIKVRGTAQQVLDKYLALARDATTSGDRIGAENYFQYAEHYYRVANADRAAAANARPQGPYKPAGDPAAATVTPLTAPQPAVGAQPEEVAGAQTEAEAKTKAEAEIEAETETEPEAVPA